MTWIDCGRRAVTVLLVALALLAVPAVARATFADRETAALSASTARMAQPAAVTGAYRCTGNVITEGFEVSVESFADAGPAGASYRYTIHRGSSIVRTATATGRSITIGSGRQEVDFRRTEWTLTIQSVLGPWTGPVYTREVTCPPLISREGEL